MQFVLVHGSFHGAWCWQHFTPYLEQRGHHVVAPNLPGSGEDPSLPENADLDSYATRIAGVIDGLAGPVVLVGHSMGGIISSQVAERRPRRLALRQVGEMVRPWPCAIAPRGVTKAEPKRLQAQRRREGMLALSWNTLPVAWHFPP